MTVPQRARTAQQAVDRYKHYLQRSLSCVHDAVWQVAKTGDGQALLLSQSPLRLRAGDGTLYFFEATQHFRPQDPSVLQGRTQWKVRTDGYAYTVCLDADLKQELFAWHWHPRTRRDTHLHVGKGHPAHGPLAAWHVPCPRISFELVARFLIEELGVQPNRHDWDGVLGDSHSRFDTFRTWYGTSRP